MKNLILSGLVIVLALAPSNLYALAEEDAVKVIMGEARGEGYKGMLAVAEVLRRRDSTKGFYGFKAKFKEPKWVWDMAKKAWMDSAVSNITNNATHFESTDFPTPYWAKNMKEVARIGKHVFYAM